MFDSLVTTRAPSTFSDGRAGSVRHARARAPSRVPHVAVGRVAGAAPNTAGAWEHRCVGCGGVIPASHGRFVLPHGHVHQGCVDRARAAGVGATKTPFLATLNDILVYVDKLDPFVEAMDEDVDKVDRELEAGLSKPVSDMKLWRKRDTIVKTWLGWPGDNTDDPPNPGYYEAWQALKKEVRGGGLLRRVWPWLIFGPLAGVALVPVVLASELPAADRRRLLWNNVRDAHIRLAEIRKELVAVGYRPSGGPLPDVPGDVGFGGLGPLGDTKGKGEAEAWYEKVPWGWIAFGFVLIAGSMALGQVRGLAGGRAAA